MSTPNELYFNAIYCGYTATRITSCDAGRSSPPPPPLWYLSPLSPPRPADSRLSFNMTIIIIICIIIIIMISSSSSSSSINIIIIRCLHR